MIYQIDLDDEIDYDANQFANINISESRRRGLLASLEHRPVAAVTLGLSYDYVDSEVTAGPFRGRRVPLVPEHRLRLYGEWRPAGGAFVRAEGLYVDERHYGGDHANRFPTMDAYHTLNLSAGWDKGPWQLSLRINNLTDQAYSETGNIGYDLVAHPGCLADAFGGFECTSENPSPGINAVLGVAYLMD